MKFKFKYQSRQNVYRPVSKKEKVISQEEIPSN